jgi:hypothetical protein
VKAIKTFAKFALGLVVCFIAIAAIFFWMADPLYFRAPKDRKLIASFQDHRVAFEKLRQMAAEDSEGYLSESHLDIRLGDKRRQAYLSLLSEIRPCRSMGGDDQTTRFIFAGGGLLAIGSGWAKGIEYVAGNTDRIGPVLENLDQPSSLATGNVYLRQIEPKWFVFFQKTE